MQEKFFFVLKCVSRKRGLQKVSSTEIQRQFLMQFEAMQSQIEILGKKTSNLRTTRDLLLPKLISGQLDVEDLEIDVGMTAEELTEAAAG